MAESAVAMLDGEMIGTDIKATMNFSQEQRCALGGKTVDQLQKKFAGVRQRLNYIVRNSTNRKEMEKVKGEKDELMSRVAELESGVSIRSTRAATSSDTNSKQDMVAELLERCRVEILCITTDLTRLDIKHVERKLRDLNAALEQIDTNKVQPNLISSDIALHGYCDRLAIQAAAMFEMARMLSDGLDVSSVLASVENYLKSTSDSISSIEDLSLRNFALLVSERLVLGYELDRVVSCGEWKCTTEHLVDHTTRSIIAQTLQRLDIFSLSNGSATMESCLSACLHSLLTQNVSGKPSLDVLHRETSYISSLIKDTKEAFEQCVRQFCSLYTTELVNFGVVNLSEVDGLLTSLTNTLCSRIRGLISSAQLSQLSAHWMYQQLCAQCSSLDGLDTKGNTTAHIGTDPKTIA